MFHLLLWTEGRKEGMEYTTELQITNLQSPKGFRTQPLTLSMRVHLHEVHAISIGRTDMLKIAHPHQTVGSHTVCVAAHALSLLVRCVTRVGEPSFS